MSLLPFDHPFAMSCLTVVTYVIAEDIDRKRLDFRLGGMTLTRMSNFPFWIICAVFVSCKVLRKAWYSPALRLLLSYLWFSKKKTYEATNMHELSLLQPKTRKKQKVDTSVVFVDANSTSRDITSATPTSVKLKQHQWV